MSNVPKLRFKEFGGEWEEKKIGECIELLTDYHANGSYEKLKENVELLDTPNFAIMIRTTNFEQNDFTKNLIYITEDAYDYLKKSKVYEDDIIINKIANAGATYIMPKIEQPVSLGMNIFLLRAKSTINKKFLFSKIKWEEYRLKALSSGTSTKTITKDDVRGFKLNLPSKPEQEKVASFLTSVDTKIKQLTKKESLLQEYKKGVMNKIFNQEIRFKDDDRSEFPEWKEKRLNKLTKIYDGTHSTPNYVEKGIPFYSVEHITANQFENTKYITEEVFEKENKRVRLERNDILMTKIGDIGTSRLIDWDVNASFYVSLALIKANSSFCSSYLNQYIKSNYFQKQLHSKTLHVAFPKKINLGEIGECIVLFPNIQEQTKIANFLSSIDKKIELTTKELNSTKEFKKALLQQMFV